MSPRAGSHLAMLAVSAMVAGSFSLGALAAPHIAPEALTALRFALASVLLLGLILAREGRLPQRALAAPWRYLLQGGVFSVYFVLMFEGLKTAPPVSAAAVYTTTPLLSALFGLLLLSQRTTLGMALAMALGAAGALWVIFRADLAALLAFDLGRGELIYFVGCLAHAFYVPLVRLLNRGESALVFTFGTTLGGTLVLAVYAFPALRVTDWAALPAIVWLTLAYTTVFSTAASFVLTQYAALHLPAANVMAYTYLVPAWVIVWQLLLGAALPPALLLPGLAMIVLALLAMLGQGRRTTPSR
ncbi:DMT family transporter [Frigidibacter sp. ROC022]|uniref:DMT family transporter n=1 Tax=Frigidibacter sp. ROC022 TaxID=2971796 RepID=UPI00215A5218|nr:DMT family transporter [Frigidibacter sp. ROC022]MCR8726482.1 DMT family transporter [Frigidibacter sp. ROC022]